MRVNPDRWDGWVQIAWIVAFITIVAAIFVIVKFGFIDIVPVGRFGYESTQYEINYILWAICIGQSIAACMVAALFSMVNSIYKNTCYSSIDPSVPSAFPKRAEKRVVDSAHPRIVKIRDSSPVFDQAYVDWSIAEVNGQSVSTGDEVTRLLEVGDNELLFIKPNGDVVEIMVTLGRSTKLNITLDR